MDLANRDDGREGNRPGDSIVTCGVIGVTFGSVAQREGVRSVPMPRTMKPTAIKNRKTVGHVWSSRTRLLTPSRMNAPPMEMYHHPSIRARRCFFSVADGPGGTTKVLRFATADRGAGADAPSEVYVDIRVDMTQRGARLEYPSC